MRSGLGTTLIKNQIIAAIPPMWNHMPGLFESFSKKFDLWYLEHFEN